MDLAFSNPNPNQWYPKETFIARCSATRKVRFSNQIDCLLIFSQTSQKVRVLCIEYEIVER